MAVDDSPHSHSARLWVVENFLRDQDEIILLHGVTTNVYVHTDGVLTRIHNRQLSHPCHGVKQGDVQRYVTANPERLVSLTVLFHTPSPGGGGRTAENPGSGFIHAPGNPLDDLKLLGNTSWCGPTRREMSKV